jgi:hypothetical protein
MILDLKDKTECRFRSPEDIPGFVSVYEDVTDFFELKLSVICDDPKDFAEYLYYNLPSGWRLVGSTTVTILTDLIQFEMGGIDYKFDWEAP